METLTKLVAMVLAVYGLANAIAVLKAGAPLRVFLEACELGSTGALRWFWCFWKTLFKCPPCLSFWIGMACSYWVFSISAGFVKVWWMAIPVDGFIVCGTSWLLHLAAERLGHGLDV